MGITTMLHDDDDVITYTYASSSTAWTPIYVSGVGALIPIATKSANVAGAYYQCGIFKASVTSSVTVSIGQQVYFDTSAGRLTTIPSTTTFKLGKALTAGTGNSAGTVMVRFALNETPDILEAKVELTSAQVLALNATPQTIIAAPGTGKYIAVEEVEGFVRYNSAAYSAAAGSDIAIRYTGSSGGIAATLETTGWLTATSSTLQLAGPSASVTPATNAAIVAHTLSAEVTTGNSPVVIKVRYRIVTAPV